MSEEIALQLLEELQLQNEFFEVFNEYLSSFTFSSSIIAILFSLFFGSFIGYILFRFLKG